MLKTKRLSVSPFLFLLATVLICNITHAVEPEEHSILNLQEYWWTDDYNNYEYIPKQLIDRLEDSEVKGREFTYKIDDTQQIVGDICNRFPHFPQCRKALDSTLGIQ